MTKEKSIERHQPSPRFLFFSSANYVFKSTMREKRKWTHTHSAPHTYTHGEKKNQHVCTLAAWGGWKFSGILLFKITTQPLRERPPPRLALNSSAHHYRADAWMCVYVCMPHSHPSHNLSVGGGVDGGGCQSGRWGWRRGMAVVAWTGDGSNEHIT